MVRFILILLLCTNIANAATRIDITKGNIDPLPIAIDGLYGDEIGRQIAGVIEADLERSGLFRPIDKNAFIDKVLNTSTQPTFASWRQINASVLITGYVKRHAGNEIEVEFRLWDTLSEQRIGGQIYQSSSTQWRRFAHKIADQIYKRLTGEEGYFDTKIVYVAESGPAKARVKRLAVMDQDGENHKFLTNGASLVLTPRFAPNMHQIMYLSYAHKKPRVYLRNIETGSETMLGDFPGMTFAPRFAPSSEKVIMSVAYEGNTNIYTLDLKTMSKQRLTNSNSIDVSPSYAPDGKSIVFNSDRGGSRQLYTMDSNGSSIKRISFGEGLYTAPSWSPRGDLIAFTKSKSGRFYIGVIRPDGSGERILTEGYLVEGPTWSPNGRVLMFTKGEPNTKTRSGSSKIYSIDLTGHNEREIITPIDASDPSWSALLR